MQMSEKILMQIWGRNEGARESVQTGAPNNERTSEHVTKQVPVRRSPTIDCVSNLGRPAARSVQQEHCRIP